MEDCMMTAGETTTTRESSTVGSESDDLSRCSTPDIEVVQEYNELMKSILPVVQPVAAPTQAAQETVGFEEEEKALGRPLTKAEKQNAKKKRRKERERDARAQEARAQREMREREEEARPVEFRLFSSRPVESVSLVHAKEEYPIPDNPRHVPLPASMVQAIRSCAAEAAVDAPTLGGIYPDLTRRGKTISTHPTGPLPQWVDNASGPIGPALVLVPRESPPKRQRTKRGRVRASM